VVLRPQKATYGTKSTVVGYDGSKIQWKAMMVENNTQAMTVQIVV